MAPRKSAEFRKMVVDEAIRAGNNLKVGKQHGVSESTLRTWIKASGRQEEARRLNPRSQKVAKRQGAPPKRKVPTADRKRTPFHLDVDNGVLEFITRKRSEVGYEFTRQKFLDEAFRIGTEKKIEGFKASIGWWNGFRSRNGIRTAKELNNRAADENEDEPLEVDPPVEDEVDPAMEIDPLVESENEDEAIDIDPPVEEGQSDPSGHSAVPEVENFHQAARASSEYLEQILNFAKPSVEVDSPVEDCQSEPGGQSENFQELALKSSDYLEDILSLVTTYNTVWASRKEQEDGILNQPSLDYGVENTSLADLIDKEIASSPLPLENISISELMETTSEDPLVPPLSSSSPSWCAGSILVENSIY